MEIGTALNDLPGTVGRTAVRPLLDSAPGQWVAIRRDISHALAASYRKATWAKYGGYEFRVRTIDGTRWLFGRAPVVED